MPYHKLESSIAPERAAITNGLLECIVEMRGGVLQWQVRAHDESLPGLLPSPMPGVSIAEASVTAPIVRSFAIHRHTEDSIVLAAGYELTPSRLYVKRFFELSPRQPFMRTWATIRADGDDCVTLTQSEMLNMVVPAPEMHSLLNVDQFSWTYRRDRMAVHQFAMFPGRSSVELRMGSFPSCFNGPTNCSWVAFREGMPDAVDAAPKSGRGMVVATEFNGKHRLHARSLEQKITIRSTIDDLRHPVSQGASFDVPACFVGFFNGDWDEAAAITHSFAEAHVHPPAPDERFPWVQYNSWGYGQDIDEAQQVKAVEICAALDIEAVVLDLGWAECIGNWWPHPRKFPNGFRPVSDLARKHGMKFGLHIGLPQAAPESRVAREHPDWLAHTDEDYFGAMPLCLGHKPCRDWLIGEVVRLIDAGGIDYLVHDGEDMVKPCTRTDHTHAPGDSNYSCSQMGLDVVIETLRTLRPNVIWENCEDGGCMLTYKMARMYHTSIAADNIDTYSTRQGIYGMSYPFTTRYSSRYIQDDPTPYTLRSVIFGGPLILMQKVGMWGHEQVEMTHAAIGEFKKYRRLIRHGRVIHLLPPLYNIEGGGWGWDAIQSVSQDGQESVVLVFRAQGSTSQRTIRPRGLESDGLYTVTLANSGKAVQTSGRQLETDGIDVALAEFASELLHIRAC